jgi:hypothetical protein
VGASGDPASTSSSARTASPWLSPPGAGAPSSPSETRVASALEHAPRTNAPNAPSAIRAIPNRRGPRLRQGSPVHWIRDPRGTSRFDRVVGLITSCVQAEAQANGVGDVLDKSCESAEESAVTGQCDCATATHRTGTSHSRAREPSSDSAPKRGGGRTRTHGPFGPRGVVPRRSTPSARMLLSGKLGCFGLSELSSTLGAPGSARGGHGLRGRLRRVLPGQCGGA